MGEVKLTPRAEAALFDIWATIAGHDGKAADRMLRRIVRKLELAADHPEMGVARLELSATARLLVEGNYLVIYEPEADGILAVAIVHGMRDQKNWLD